ncbi:hypothetical protein CYMTET_18524 [Cymbomonas tetramitiformis]|uniref:Uncharacterized protein n=1 Tax=Cymbomonas tetramitiformis TaxID=36881 RepID=A0AAE0G976_9CHLO|nr:hypothetical protein CYMTET_18524 [Cymbomonas tetramitiformis]
MQVENDKQKTHELSMMHMLAAAIADQAPAPLPTAPPPVVAPSVAAHTVPPEALTAVPPQGHDPEKLFARELKTLQQRCR